MFRNLFRDLDYLGALSCCRSYEDCLRDGKRFGVPSFLYKFLLSDRILYEDIVYSRNAHELRGLCWSV